MKGGNVTVGPEKLLDLFVSHVGGQVFDENVVEGLSYIGAALRVEFDSDEAIFSLGGAEGFLGVFGVLEANESITTRSVPLVEGNLAGDYTSELRKFLFQVVGLEVLTDLSDEHVLFLQLGKIDSK